MPPKKGKKQEEVVEDENGYYLNLKLAISAEAAYSETQPEEGDGDPIRKYDLTDPYYEVQFFLNPEDEGPSKAEFTEGVCAWEKEYRINTNDVELVQKINREKVSVQLWATPAPPEGEEVAAAPVPDKKGGKDKKGGGKDKNAPAVEAVKVGEPIVMPIHTLIVGDKKVERNDSREGISAFSVSMAPDAEFLSEDQAQALNPLRITCKYAKNMPRCYQPDVSHEELREIYEPVYLRYKFFCEENYVKTEGLAHDKNIQFDDVRVFLTGLYNQNELADKLESEFFVVELHDRVYRPLPPPPPPKKYGKAALEEEEKAKAAAEGAATTPPPPAEGEGEEDEKEEVVAKEEPPEPHGITKLKLADLCLGVRSLDLGGDVIPFRPKRAELTAEYKPEPHSSQYVHQQTTLQISLSLHHPVFRVRPPTPTPEDGPFERAMFLFKYEDTPFLQKLQGGLNEVNRMGLGLVNAPSRILATLKLSDEQKADSTLDVITGFQVMDDEYRMVVVEGLNGGEYGMTQLERIMKRDERNHPHRMIVFNSEVTFKNRLYANFNVDLKRIKLVNRLHYITTQVVNFVESIVHDTCKECLRRLREMRKIERIRHAKHLNIFPTEEQLLALEKKYGEVLEKEDEEGVAIKTAEELDDVALALAGLSVEKRLRKKRSYKAPTDRENEEFEAHLVQRKEEKPEDYIKKNIRFYAGSEKRAPPDYGDGELYCYAGQRFNYTELQLRYMAEEFAKDTKHHYTFGDTLASQFPLVHLDDKQREDEALHKSRFITKEGLRVVTARDPMEYIKHPKKPSQSRIDELNEPWIENTYFPPAFVKDPLANGDGVRPPFNTVSGNPRGFNPSVTAPVKTATFDSNNPEMAKSVFYGGAGLIKEQRDTLQKEIDQWRNKVVVDDYNFKTYLGNELRGPKVHQLDKKDDIRKDPPYKRGIRFAGPDYKKHKLAKLPHNILMDDQYEDGFRKDPSMPKKLDTTLFTDKNKKDFCRFSSYQFPPLTYEPRSLRKIKPLEKVEKRGPIWGNDFSGPMVPTPPSSAPLRSTRAG